MRIDPNKLAFLIFALILLALNKLGCGETRMTRSAATRHAIEVCKMYALVDRPCNSIKVISIGHIDNWAHRTSVLLNVCGKRQLYEYGRWSTDSPSSCRLVKGKP